MALALLQRESNAHQLYTYLMQLYQRKFEGQVDQLESVRTFVIEATGKLHLRQEDAFACQLAVDEAATNAWKHSYAGQPGLVEVTVRRDEGHVYLTVHNWGVPFDPDKVTKPRIDLPLEQRPIGGLGIFLMRKFMDEVSFGFDSVEGNTVTMKRKLSG